MLKIVADFFRNICNIIQSMLYCMCNRLIPRDCFVKAINLIGNITINALKSFFLTLAPKIPGKIGACALTLIMISKRNWMVINNANLPSGLLGNMLSWLFFLNIPTSFSTQIFCINRGLMAKLKLARLM